MFTGVDSVISAIDSFYADAPYYSVWSGKDMIFQYSSEDFDAGRKRLYDLLQSWSDSGNSQIFAIKFYAKFDSGYITSKTPDIGTMTIRAVGFDTPGVVSGVDGAPAQSGSAGGYLPYPVWEALKGVGSLKDSLQQNFDTINSRLMALESPEDTEPEPEPKTLIQTIGEVLSLPIVQQLIPQILSSPVIAGLLGGTPNTQTTAHISGINDTPMATAEAPAAPVTGPQNEQEALESINDSLERLSHHCDLEADLKKLADVAEQKPEIFKMLLQQLRSL
ncbi:MAG: hypothetical protein ABW007_02095 [Chitinophagaceae bacterium]